MNINLTFNNLVSVDTTEWKDADSVINTKVEGVEAGHKYYVGINQEIKSDLNVSDISKYEYYLSVNKNNYSGETGLLYRNIIKGVDNTINSLIFTLNDDYDLDYFVVSNFSINREISANVIGDRYRHLMVIDITDLLSEFPSFAELDADEQKDVLNALPYFFGSFTVGKALSNIVLKDKQSNVIENTTNSNDAYYVNTELVSIDDYTINERVYARITAKHELENLIPYNFSYIVYFNTPQENIIIVNGTEIKDYFYTVSNLHNINKEHINSLIRVTSYGLSPDGSVPESFLNRLTWNEAIIVNLTAFGHYTLFRLMGMTDDDIKNYLDSIPFFQDSVNLDVITSKITMTCDTEDAVIHYTLDGSDPTEDSLVYTKPFLIGGDHVVKAIGYKEGYEPSNIASVTVDVSETTTKPATPELILTRNDPIYRVQLSNGDVYSAGTVIKYHYEAQNGTEHDKEHEIVEGENGGTRGFTLISYMTTGNPYYNVRVTATDTNGFVSDECYYASTTDIPTA